MPGLEPGHEYCHAYGIKYYKDFISLTKIKT
jgi:hypothetical protein